MLNIKELIDKFIKEGYSEKNAEARVFQDVVLRAIGKSALSERVTIKGGVVMRSITGNSRRATQDIDIDFIRYSLSDESIDMFLEKINCLEEVKITRKGTIQQLTQQDYNGKRVLVIISDNYGNSCGGKIDLGVHKHLDIAQEEYCFDIGCDDEGVTLFINSREQMFAEKLRSLLKFGAFSTRYKDIYDMYYYCDKVNIEKLKQCFSTYIFDDPGMRENNLVDVAKRVKAVFGDSAYKDRVSSSDKRWLDDDIDDIFEGIIIFLEDVNRVGYALYE